MSDSDYFKPLVNEESEDLGHDEPVEISEEELFEVTARNIVQGTDMFREDAKDLSKKELYRLLCHVVEYPMDNTTKIVTGGKEELLANRAKVIKDDQFMLTVKFLQEEGKGLTNPENNDTSNETQEQGDIENE